MTVHNRTAWKARKPKGVTKLVPADVKFVAVHWPGSEGHLPVEDVAAQLRGWQDFHMDDRGWRDIAYNEAVDQNGDVWMLRGPNADGSVKDMGGEVYSILAVYGVPDTPSQAMLATIKERVALAQKTYTKAKVVGHRDLKSTDCPGDKVYDWLQHGMPLEGTTPEPDPEPDPEPEPAGRDDLFRFATYNAQLPQFDGGPVGDDIRFLRNVLKPSILAMQEVNEKYREAIEAHAGFNYYTGKTLLLGWLPKKWHQGEIIKDLLDTPYHGVVGTELTSLENKRSLVAATGHGLPNDAFPKTWSKEKVLKEKLDAITGMIDVLDKYPRVVVGGDWNVPDVRPIFLKRGYTLASPFISTVDGSGTKRYDLVFVKGLVIRAQGQVIPTDASDHHGVLAHLTLPGKDLS